MSVLSFGNLLARRSFLLGASAATAVAATVTVLRHSDAAPVPSLPRRNIADPAVDPTEVELFREAVRRLKAKDSAGAAADGWQAIASPHVDHCFTNDLREMHFGWWFLPWHRAYLLSMERRLQTIVAEPNLRLFYWDWFSTNTTPAAYATANIGSPARPNALFDNTRAKSNADRPDGYKFDTVGPQLLGYDKEADLVSPKKFTDFAGGEIPQGVKPSKPGSLEMGPHNHVHVWVGGRTGIFAQAASPRDAIFLAHHANIDRLWTVWLNNTAGLRPGEKRTNPASTFWNNQTFPMPHPSGVGTDTFKISDLLDTRSQGYFYDKEQVVAPATPVALNVPGPLRLTLNKTPLSVGRDLRTTENIALGVDQVSRLREFAFDPTQAGRVVFENVEVPAGATKVDVFFNTPGAAANDPNNLVGSFSLLNPGDTPPPPLTFSLPVPDRVRRLIANQPNLSFSLRAEGAAERVNVQNVHFEVE